MHFARSFTSALVGSAILVLTACGSDSGDAKTLSASSQALLAANCSHLQKCQPLVLEIQYGTVDNCTTVLSSDSQDNLPGNDYTDAQVKACSDAINGASCDADVGALAACQIKGTLGNGTPCNGGTQCSSGYCQLGDDTTGSSSTIVGQQCGKCAPIAADGAACTEDDGCNLGSECDSTKHVCSPRPAKGAACTPDVDCQAGSVCIASVCSDLLPAGSVCDSSDNSCATGLACEASKCTDTSGLVVAVDVGQSCGLDPVAQKDNVCKFSSCVGATGAAKCVAFATANQPCAWTTAPVIRTRRRTAHPAWNA